MAIGAPGSGKTTVLKPFAERYGYTYVSADEIRKELTGDMSDQSSNRTVWEEVFRRVAESLRVGTTVVVDATFAHESDRKRMIAHARTHGADKVQGVLCAVPLEVSLERNRARSRVVPELVIRRMHGALVDRPPVVEEGFDSVVDLDECLELKRAETQGEHAAFAKEFSRGMRK